MNPTFDFFNSFIDLSEETFIKLQKISSYKKVKAHTKVTKTGKIPTKIYLLTSGLMRAYLISENGKEYNKNIFSPMSFVAPLTALIKNEPSELAYETLTDCECYEFSFKDLINLCKTELSVSLLYIKILEQVFMMYEKRNLELLSLNATQRYIKLRKQIHNLDNLIPQFQIASYLSITPVQLSRIRKNLK